MRHRSALTGLTLCSALAAGSLLGASVFAQSDAPFGNVASAAVPDASGNSDPWLHTAECDRERDSTARLGGDTNTPPATCRVPDPAQPITSARGGGPADTHPTHPNEPSRAPSLLLPAPQDNTPSTSRGGGPGSLENPCVGPGRGPQSHCMAPDLMPPAPR